MLRSPSVTVRVSQGSRRTLRSRTDPATVGSQNAVLRLMKEDMAAWGAAGPDDRESAAAEVFRKLAAS